MRMYDVGQVLFIVVRKKQKIVPVQIVEQIVRRSLDGEAIQYQVKVPGYDDPMPINCVGEDIYSSIDEVKDALKQNASSAIDDMARAATSLSATSFQDMRSLESAEGGGDEEAVVDLGDGKKAKINVSSLKKLHL